MKCPSFERLIDYLDGRLTRTETDSVAAHLIAGCEACAENRRWYERVQAVAASDDSIEPPPWVLKRAVKLFGSKPARPRVIERIGSVVASLVFDSLARPALAGVRSTETANRQLLYLAGDYSIDLQIASSGETRLDLIGQVLRDEGMAFESVAGLSLQLMSGDETIAATVTNEMGEFSISQIDQGEYDLRVETARGSIIVSGLPVAQS